VDAAALARNGDRRAASRCERLVGAQRNGASTPRPEFDLPHTAVEALAEVAAYGEVVWSWHPLPDVKLSGGETGPTGKSPAPLSDGDKKEFVAEESTK